MNSSAGIGGAILLAVLAFVLFGLVSARDPNTQEVVNRLAAPSTNHPFGTDEFGRDILARMAHGARTTLTVGASVALGAGLCGLVLGLVAGYYRRLDSLLMRIADGLMAFPSIVLALGLVAAFGPRVSNLVAALAIVYTPRVARLVRGTVLTLNGQEFVTAARALGASDNRIILNHLLRNLMNVLIVQVTYVFALAIVAESALSFLGVSDSPDQPTWGSILSAGRQYIYQAPFMTFFPGLAIAITVLGLNFLGDGLQDLLDPRLKARRAA